ncbi:hypothetical protein CTI16_10250 [Prevotella intermedia]|uniref:Uncharacterized protein n=1 Tax=Prevotella intermedia TaxID=28131 RepID=A0AAJ3RHL6_PREIN|nr:hypothetical protein CTI16_10250 [Prevotella intermedia]
MALRKRLFCVAKQPLLPCKTYAFRTPNNRFYNALIASELHVRYAYEKIFTLFLHVSHIYNKVCRRSHLPL